MTKWLFVEENIMYVVYDLRYMHSETPPLEKEVIW